MEEQDLLDSTSLCSFPRFNEAKHNVLCSELKQLYVAVTRTRQRLWICENEDEFCRPMFDYWKKKYIVQVKHLDESLAQAMQVASSPEEWRSRGIKVSTLCIYAIDFDPLLLKHILLRLLMENVGLLHGTNHVEGIRLFIFICMRLAIVSKLNCLKQ
jgi:hypothetical protein